MPSVGYYKEGDTYFDACDGDARSSTEASSSVGCCTTWRPEYDLWTREPVSVSERRRRFLDGMGFAEQIPTGATADFAFCDLEERFSSICSSFRSSFSQCASAPDSAYCVKDLDSGNRYLVHEIERDGLTSLLEEFGTDKILNINQSESFLRFSQLLHELLRKGGARSLATGTKIPFSPHRKDHKSFCGRFTSDKGESAISMSDLHSKNTLSRTKVEQKNKKWMDFSAVYMCQEIQAHGGAIRVMKFSPSGRYLASVGEDCIVRVWVIREVESSPDVYRREAPVKYMDRSKGLRRKLAKGRSRILAIIPKKVFSISETPWHEFRGHTSDILDMTWSKSDLLLTASKDRTVRMWKVGYDGCLAVYKHRDYVTCVQFNPVDERYFMSGSIDGKVRVWDVSEQRVADWDDTRDIITAVCYQPDGKGIIVGTVTGKCRFYDHSGEIMELERVMRVKKKKSSTGNRITGLQFSRSDPSRVIITSADSKIRVSEGVGITQKFEGRRSSKFLLPPSPTSDGRYLVSSGADSNVYIWSLDASSSRSVRSCELFFSKGVASVATWPGSLPPHGGDNDLRAPEKEGWPTVCRDRECCSFGTWFLADSTGAAAATWPEEKLLPSLKYVNCAGLDGCCSKVSAAWNTVVVTGGRDGVIRCFHNYGLPMKL